MLATATTSSLLEVNIRKRSQYMFLKTWIYISFHRKNHLV